MLVTFEAKPEAPANVANVSEEHVAGRRTTLNIKTCPFSRPITTAISLALLSVKVAWPLQANELFCLPPSDLACLGLEAHHQLPLLLG
jgi:hypothetical protein